MAVNKTLQLITMLKRNGRPNRAYCSRETNDMSLAPIFLSIGRLGVLESVLAVGF
jgi:hypothetical protein